MSFKTSPKLLEELEAQPHCLHCPTLQGEYKGRDPIMLDLFADLESLQQQGKELYCPWRDKPCCTYARLWEAAVKHYKDGYIMG